MRQNVQQHDTGIIDSLVLHMLLPLHCLHLLLVHWCCARRCCYHHCLHFRSVPRCLKHSAGPGQKLILGGACVADCTCKRSLYVPMSTNFELHGNICHMSYLICPHVSMPIDLQLHALAVISSVCISTCNLLYIPRRAKSRQVAKKKRYQNTNCDEPPL